MKSNFKSVFLFAALAFLQPMPGVAAAPSVSTPPADPRMSERVLGKADAPVKVDEFVSLTCTHCADFYVNVLPKLEAKYVDSGKVKFVMHDFPIDGLSLKAAAVARCMPEDEFFPFVKTLYATQDSWAFAAGSPEGNLIQTAKLGGLDGDKAKACADDEKLQKEILDERTVAADKFNIGATPTFVLNDGAETIKGAQGPEVFSAAFDRLLAAKK